jgi:nitrogen fixation NifU-like protein
MSIYQEIILAHYHHPHNKGVIPDSDLDAHVVNSVCGDSIRITARLKGNNVIDIAFDGEGCAISTASASMLTEHVKNMSKSQVMKLSKDDVLSLLGIELTPGRLKCALLPLEAIHNALQQAKG